MPETELPKKPSVEPSVALSFVSALLSMPLLPPR